MSPNEDDRKRDLDDDQNSFIAFRRFVDEQMETAFQGLNNLPRVFDAFRSSFDGLERDARQAWQRFNDSYERSTNPERRRIEPYPPSASIDPLASDSQPPEMVLPFNFSHPFFLHTVLPVDSKLFLHHDLYSPLILEKLEARSRGLDSGRYAYGKWRHAYEDLIVTGRGEPLTNPHKHCSSSNEHDSVWVTKLADKGLLQDSSSDRDMGKAIGQIVKSLSALPGVTGFPSEDDGPATELDLYERFLEGQPRRSKTKHIEEQPASSRQSRQRSISSSTDDNLESAPTIVSTFSTTRRQTLPDGTVRTKHVLKKKFSDGHEEVEESINTTRVPPEQSPILSQLQKAKDSTKSAFEQTKTETVNGGSTKDTKRKNEGWFWSGS